MVIRLKLFFAQLFLVISSVTTEQSQICVVNTVLGDICEEYSTCQTRTERPVLARQSDPLSEPAKSLITTPTPSIEIPAQEILLQKYKERVERLSPQD